MKVQFGSKKTTLKYGRHKNKQIVYLLSELLVLEDGMLLLMNLRVTHDFLSVFGFKNIRYKSYIFQRQTGQTIYSFFCEVEKS